jgi:hypothetical protein
MKQKNLCSSLWLPRARWQALLFPKTNFANLPLITSIESNFDRHEIKFRSKNVLTSVLHISPLIRLCPVECGGYNPRELGRGGGKAAGSWVILENFFVFPVIFAISFLTTDKF